VTEEQPEPWPEGGVVQYTPKWAKDEGPATRIWAQETGVVMRVTRRGVFVRYGTDETPKLTDAEDLALIIRPGTYVWKPGDPEELREAETSFHGGWLSVPEREHLEATTEPHEFEGGVGTYFSPACTRLVERDGDGEDCGLPASSIVHITRSKP
jgi:hypothetical protein